MTSNNLAATSSPYRRAGCPRLHRLPAGEVPTLTRVAVQRDCGIEKPRLCRVTGEMDKDFISTIVGH
jgi:hypothetical protein